MTDNTHVITKVEIIPWEKDYGTTGIAYWYDSGLSRALKMPLEEAQQEVARVGEREPVALHFPERAEKCP